MHEPSRDGLADPPDHWPPGSRPWWWVTPDDRDREADAADAAAELRDERASRRDADAADLDHTATDREHEAITRLTVAHRRLTQADDRDTDRLAATLAALEAARTLHAPTGAEEPHPALVEAEAACEAETLRGVGNGIERRATREEFGHASQHLAASASHRRAAAHDRAHAHADRQAASNDRGLAKANRQQSALDRAADPDLSLYQNP